MSDEAMLYEQFAEADQLDLPAGASAQAGATIRKNLEQAEVLCKEWAEI